MRLHRVPRIDLALDEALTTIDNLTDLLDVEGVGQDDPGLKAAREFQAWFMEFVRYRACCSNCAYFHERGRKKVCRENPSIGEIVLRRKDPGIAVCKYYRCKYEDCRKRGGY